MKLSYVATIRFPTEKAHGLAIAKMCEALVAHGVKLELVVPDRKQSRQLIGRSWSKLYGIKTKFSVYRLLCLDLLWANWYLPSWFHGFTYFLLTVTFSLSLIPFLLRRQKQIVYTRDFFLVPLLLILKKKVFIEVHNWPNKPWLVWLYKVLGRRAAGFVCISPALVNECKRSGISSEKLLLAESGVPQEFFKKSSRKIAREKVNLPQEKKIILYLGSLAKEKGIGTLLNAAKRLGHNPKILFIIVGGSFVEREEVELVRRMRQLPNVVSLGFQEYAKVPWFLTAADILVLPNSYVIGRNIFKKYTSPMKLFEYLASERPVIASKIPALKEIVEDKKQVLFFTPDDADDLIKKINNILENKELAKSLVIEGKKLALEHTWSKRAVKVIQFIKDDN